MRRKLVQPFLPNLQFKENLLSVPGYVFEEVRCTPPLTRTIPIIQLPQAKRWEDTGSQTLLAEGTSLKDGSNVLAKIAPATGSGAICLEREAHLCVLICVYREETFLNYVVSSYH